MKLIYQLQLTEEERAVLQVLMNVERKTPRTCTDSDIKLLESILARLITASRLPAS